MLNDGDFVEVILLLKDCVQLGSTPLNSCGRLKEELKAEFSVSLISAVHGGGK
jgi:hypothetical protein